MLSTIYLMDKSMEETRLLINNPGHFLQAVTDIMSEIVTIIALPSGDILYTNRPSFRFQTHPDDLPAMQAWYQRLATLGDNGKITTEYRVSNDNGDLIYLSAQGRIFQRDNTNTPTHALIVAQDLTEQKKAGLEIMRLERHERDQSFLSSITKDLVELKNMTDAMEELGEKIANYFQVPWCTFTELTDDPETGVFSYGWNDSNSPSLNGTYRRQDLWIAGQATDGAAAEVIVTCDTQSDPRLNAATFAALGIGSYIAVPLAREGKFRFLHSITDTKPRQWRDDEIRLMQDLATRIWSRVERARVEEALKKSEQKYRAIFNSINEGFTLLEVLFDTEDNACDILIHDANPAQNRVDGVQAIIGKRVREILPDIEQKWIDRYAKVVRTGEPEHFEDWSEANHRWYEVNASRVGGPGSPLVTIVYNDINDRKTTEEALRNSEALLASVFKVSPVGLGLADATGKYLLLNDEMRRFLPTGLMPSKDDERSSRWIAYNPDGSAIERDDYPGIRALRGEPVPPFTEMLYADDDGNKIWTKISSIPIRNEKDEITGVVTVLTDIDELKRTAEALQDSERQLKQLIRQKDDFIGIASHELKTPVTSMKMYADIVQERLDELGDKGDSDLLSKLNAQIDRLTSLINHLLDTTRISEGQLKLALERIDIKELLTERIEEISRITNHHFVLQAQDRSTILADRERIGQVITNLLSNAVKYSPKGTTITITSRADNDGVTVSVRDEGYGIPEKDVSKVFDRFFRVSANNMDTFPGMGLGLYITDQIVHKHGGTIAVKSKEGVGSTFTFTLPDKIK